MFSSKLLLLLHIMYIFTVHLSLYRERLFLHSHLFYFVHHEYIVYNFSTILNLIRYLIVLRFIIVRKYAYIVLIVDNYHIISQTSQFSLFRNLMDLIN